MSMTDEQVQEAFRAAREAEKARTQPETSGESPYAGLPGYRAPAPPPPKAQAETTTFMPWSTNEQGEFVFPDWPGTISQPAQLTKDVMTGRMPTDPRNPAYIGGALESALNFGPGSAAARKGMGGVLRPSVDETLGAGAAGFAKYRQSGQQYPDIVGYFDYLKSMKDNLNKQGLVDTPDAAARQHKAIQNEMDRVQKELTVNAANIDALHTSLRGRGPASMQARNDLYQYIEAQAPIGDTTIRDAVGNYRQAMHAERLNAKEYATSLKNQSAAQGPELSAQQQRNNITNLLIAHEKKSQGLSDAEVAVMEGAVKGSPGLNLAQRGGEALRPGSSIPSGVAATATFGGTAAAGAGLRSLANRGARRDMETVKNFILSQSPLARSQFATAPNNFKSMGPSAYSVMANPAIAGAIKDRLRSKGLLPTPDVPQTYRVLPDGTIEEFM